MAEAYERSEWNRMSVLVAKLHNVNQVKEAGMITFEDVHPHYLLKRQRSIRKANEPTHEQIALLKHTVQGMQ